MGRSVAVAAGSIALITLVARVVGFGRWFAFSHSVGATCVGSVYQSVNAVPNVLFEVAAGGVLAAVAVPLVAGALAARDRASADRTASALLTWSLVVLVPLGALVAVAAHPVAAALLGSGGGSAMSSGAADGAGVAASCAGAVGLGADLLRVFAVQIPLYGVGIVLAGVLQSHGRFVGAALAPLLSSLVVIATYLAYRGLVLDPTAQIARIPSNATLVLGVGTTLGVVALSLPLLWPAVRARIRLRPTLSFPEGIAPRVHRLAVAGLLAVAGQQVATLVVIRLANDRGGSGTLNVYTYVQAVSLLPYAVLAVPLATAAFPTLAGHVYQRDPAAEAGNTHGGASGAVASSRALRATWLATVTAGLLAAGLLVAVARPVGGFFALLDAGRSQASGAEALATIPDALLLVAPGILALSLIGLLSRASYVRGRARTAGLVVAVGWLATTLLPLLALPPTAGPGPTLRALAGGTSLGLVLSAAVLVALVARAWGPDVLRVRTRSILAPAVGAGLAAVVGWSIGGRWAATTLWGALGASVAVGVVAAAVFGAAVLLIDAGALRQVVRHSGARTE